MSQTLSKNPQPVTMAQVAARAGVSVPTVSYILNNREKERRLSPDTVSRVRAIAEELGYVRNGLARSLRRRSTQSIAMLVSDLERGWANRVMKGLIGAVDNAGYLPSISVHFWDPARERREIASFLEEKKAAIVLRPMAANLGYYRMIAQRGVPLVLLDEVPGLEGASTVRWDTREVIRTSIAGLVDRGLRRIGYVGVRRGTLDEDQRYHHFREALRDFQLPFEEFWACIDDLHTLEEDTGPRRGRLRHYGESVASLLRDPATRPDALFSSNDAMACMCLTIARDDLGLSVPEEIAVMGMGDVGETALIGLSSSREPLEEIGRLAGETALSMIEHGATHTRRILVPGGEVSFRSTTPQKEVSIP